MPCSRGADAMLAWRPPARLAPRAPRLRWIQSLTGGCEQWLGPDVPATVVLTCARGTHRVQMTEHILAALFMCAKDLAGIVLRSGRAAMAPAGESHAVRRHPGHPRARRDRRRDRAGRRAAGHARDRHQARATPLPHVVQRACRRPRPPRVLAESDYVLLLLPSTVETKRDHRQDGAGPHEAGRLPVELRAGRSCRGRRSRRRGERAAHRRRGPRRVHDGATAGHARLLDDAGDRGAAARGRLAPPARLAGGRPLGGEPTAVSGRSARCEKSSTAPAAIRSVSEYRRAPRLRRDPD